MTDNFIYLYGIIKDNVFLNDDINGVNRTKLNLIDYNNFYVIYDYIDKNRCEVDLNLLEEHNGVLTDLLSESIVLPFSFGTVVNSKRAVDEFINRNKVIINNLLKEYKDKIEVGLKIYQKTNLILNEDKVKTGEKNNTEKSKASLYMKKLYNNYKENKEKVEQINQRVTPLINLLKKNCYKYTSEYRNEGVLLLNAAYLIEKNKFSFFKESIEDFNSKNKDFICKFSGPWAPYNFVNIEQGAFL